jgi:ABC-type sugar transport system permease subunit
VVVQFFQSYVFTLPFVFWPVVLTLISDTILAFPNHHSIDVFGRRCKETMIVFPSTIEQATTAAEGFQSVSMNDAIYNCVAAVDGYHLQIRTPSKKEAKNVRSFFWDTTRHLVLTCRQHATIILALFL